MTRICCSDSELSPPQPRGAGSIAARSVSAIRCRYAACSAHSGPPHHHNQAGSLPSRQMYGCMYGCMYGWTGGSACMPVCMYVCIYGWLDTARRSHRGIPVLLRDEASQQLGAARLGGVTTPLCKPGRRVLVSQIPIFSIEIMSRTLTHDSYGEISLFFSQHTGPRHPPISPRPCERVDLGTHGCRLVAIPKVILGIAWRALK